MDLEALAEAKERLLLAEVKSELLEVISKDEGGSPLKSARKFESVGDLLGALESSGKSRKQGAANPTFF